MKLIDRLVMKELFGLWLFGVGLFTSLLLAATYLNRIADYVVRGVPPATVLKLTAVLLPAILVKTFSMAILLGALLAFGRLSSDSEIVALRASGASIARIVAPVMVFSMLLAGLTFGFNELVVPQAATKAKEMLVELANSGDVQSGDPVIIPLDGGKAVLSAKAFNLAAKTMTGVNITAYDEKNQPTYVLLASELEWLGEKNWHLRGKTTLLSAAGGWRLDTNEVWPEQLPKLNQTPLDIVTINNNDNDIYTLSQIRTQIESTHLLSKAKIANLWYGYWTKFSVPLAAFIFGTLGAVLGIRNSRTGTSTGFALAVVIIFAYVTLANFMNVWALNGVLPAWVAAFMPVLIGFVGAMYLIWRRNA